MALTYKVNVWELKTLKPGANGKKRPKPYGVCWITAGKEHSEWYRTKALANNRRAKLITATQNGEAFDVATSLPESEIKTRSDRSLLQLAQQFIAHEWGNAAPNTRKRYVDTLAVPVMAFVAKVGKPLAAAEWISKASRSVRELDKIETSTVLQALGRNLDGKMAAAWTTRTRRGVFHHVLSFAVDLEELPSNPVTGLRSSVQRGTSEVDPRVVLNPAQARACLDAVALAGSRSGQFGYLRGFFATMYYAGMRPCEVNRLRDVDCKLPDTGWGELVLEKSASRTVGRYTDSGELWEERNLKRRAEGAVRVVPIPPQLVAILREHIEEFGTTPDGRLFRGLRTGAPVGASVYCDVWWYDLRHAAVSTWLAAGLPPAEVAERAGHTVDVLLKVYAKVLDGQRDTSNRKIDQLLSASWTSEQAKGPRR